MQILYPDMQPIRFYKIGETPDYITYFPNHQNITHRFEYVPGLHPTEYYTDWVINYEILIQFRIQVIGQENLSVYKYNTSTQSYDLYTTITPVNISPSGWTLDQVNRYSFTPSVAGVYYIESSSAEWRSDKFVVHSSLKFRKRLFKISYYNTENDYFMIFYDNDTNVYTPTAFFTGALYPDSPGNDMSVFETDRGNPQKQRSTPQNIMNLKMLDIHYAELTRINLIFSCDTITVNGVTWQSKEAMEVEQIQNSDLVNITINLIQTDYNYFQS